MKVSYILIRDDVDMGTPDVFAESSRTQDITAEELAQDYNLQKKLRLLTQVCIVPEAPWADPTPPSERRKMLASYLSAFKSDKKEEKAVYDYLMNNGVIRIVWKQPN